MPWQGTALLTPQASPQRHLGEDVPMDLRLACQQVSAGHCGAAGVLSWQSDLQCPSKSVLPHLQNYINNLSTTMSGLFQKKLLPV